MTGAGSGLGRALAVEMAGRGAEVALCDRRADTLAETAGLVSAFGGRARTATVDVADRQAMRGWADSVVAERGRVDGLISNAGMVLPWRPLQTVPYDHLRRIVEVNLWGAVHGALAFLPHLRERSEASIVIVSSLAGLAAAPDQVGYCMSKFAVRGFTEALHMELAGTSVHTMIVLPGGIKHTAIMRDALGATAEEASRGEKLAAMPLTPTATQVARRIVTGIEHGKTRLVIGKDATVMSLIARAFPARYPSLLLPAFNRLRHQFQAPTTTGGSPAD